MAEKTPDTSKSNIDYASLFFVMFAILLGGYARLGQVLKSDFPLNDGGMFYQMTVDLQANDYRLPLTSSYNGLEIPYVYPPLPFYFIGMISDSLNIELIELYKVLPAVISVFTIPAFYLLAKELLGNQSRIALAVIMFALMPSTFSWLIVGGGITRSLGFLASIMTLQQAYRMYTHHKWMNILGVMIFASVSVLSHPEAGIHTAVGVLVMFLFFGRHQKGVMHSLITAGLVLVMTASWWLTVLQRHGLSPILAASQTGLHSFQGIYLLWLFNFTNEFELSIIGVSALIGVFWVLSKRNFFLPTFLLATYLSEPRGAPLYISPILAMLASIVLDHILIKLNSLESVRISENDGSSNWAEHLFAGRVSKILFIVFLTQWMFYAIALPTSIQLRSTLTGNDLEAFEWVQNNIPSESNFGMVTGMMPLTDPVSEWFPVLTDMRSLYTPQGHEWLPESDFNQILYASEQLQECTKQDIGCIRTLEKSNNSYFEYLYLRKIDITMRGDKISVKSPLEMSLIGSGDYISIYHTPEVSILQKQ